jgi:hypothetical protein
VNALVLDAGALRSTATSTRWFAMRIDGSVVPPTSLGALGPRRAPNASAMIDLRTVAGLGVRKNLFS